ncbi:MAG: MBL fold metallo-hydrolase [Syntrophales bacterium]|jgi:glyoxylase-like metal-dependent hydrolase (beta-lactamase superfamily II)
MSDNIKVINLYFVNAFLIKIKDGYILIDTGLPQQWEKLDEELMSAGCLPGRLKLVIITHGDWDHTGNCATLQEKFKAKIAMHSADAFMAEGYVFLKRKIRSLSRRIFFMFMMLMMRLRRNKISFNKFKSDILLANGQDMGEYGFDAKIIHIPGHTKGSIGILTNEGDLFAGDTFVDRRKPDSAQIIANIQELENSIDMLKKMSIKMVYPGHGKPFMMEKYLKTQQGHEQL